MNLWKQQIGYLHSKDKEELIKSRDWHIFRWEFWAIILLGLISFTLFQIPNWIANSTSSISLRGNIYYNTFVLLFIVATIIFINLFSEIGGLNGKLGITTLTLVPFFIWIFATQGKDSAESIYKFTTQFATALFALMFILAGTFTATYLFKYSMRTNLKWQKSMHKVELIFSLIYRIHIAIINVLIVALIGIAFVNYGWFSLKLVESKGNIKVFNSSSPKMVTYTIISGVIFIIIMLLIGLTREFMSPARSYKRVDEKHLEDEIDKEYIMTKTDKDLVEQTQKDFKNQNLTQVIELFGAKATELSKAEKRALEDKEIEKELLKNMTHEEKTEYKAEQKATQEIDKEEE